MADANQQKQPRRMPAFSRMLDDFLRRSIDVIGSAIGLILLSPLFLLVSFAIKRSSPGPVFYWGTRAGKNNKPFKILKFRTMYERKESYDGPKVTAENDSRITPLGKTLRQTKINELPQLWNVLIGDMSLVGPRPEDPAIAAEWPEDVRNEILSVRPGITSPASVVYRNEEDLLQSSNLMDTYFWDILPSKLRLDQLYVRNRSALSDIDVIFWTAVALIPRLKSFSVPEYLLYWGPLSRFTYHYLGWFFVDFIVSFLAVATAGILRRLTTPFDLGVHVSILIALAIALLFSLINALAGLNRINWAKARMQDAFDLAFSTGVVTLVVMVANVVFPTGNRFPMSVILVSGILSYSGFVLVRYRTRLLSIFAKRWLSMRSQSQPNLGERVLIVGAGEVARFSVWLLSNESLAQAFKIVGMVDDDPRTVGTKVEGYQVISTTSAIPDLVKKHDIGLILFAIADIQPAEQERILSLCQTTQARIVPIPEIIESLRAQFPKNDADREVHFNKVIHNATTDRLTGAYNRTHFLRLAETEFSRARRYDRPLSIILIAVDYDRPEKTRFTKATGSQVLQRTARCCIENVRSIDLIGRVEDQVLVVMLPETELEPAHLVAQRLRQRISELSIKTSSGVIHPILDVNVLNSRETTFNEFEEIVTSGAKQNVPVLKKNETIVVGEAKLK